MATKEELKEMRERILSQEVIIKDEDKQEFFNKNYCFGEPPDFNETRYCLHCGEIIRVGDFKVQREEGFDFICCPNWPDCDGTIADWMPEEKTTVLVA